MNLKRVIKSINNIGNSIGKRLINDAIIIEGFVEITNGDTHIKAKNSIVDQGLIGIINFMSANSNNGDPPSFNWVTPTAGNSTMILGSDTTHGTIGTTTALTTAIGAPTIANTQGGATSNPAAGQWQVQWTATWNPATIANSPTLGEIGLRLYIIPTLQAFGASTTATSNTFFSRMASFDGKFVSSTIDNTKPLLITWTFLLTYAT